MRSIKNAILFLMLLGVVVSCASLPPIRQGGPKKNQRMDATIQIERTGEETEINCYIMRVDTKGNALHYYGERASVGYSLIQVGNPKNRRFVMTVEGDDPIQLGKGLYLQPTGESGELEKGYEAREVRPYDHGRMTMEVRVPLKPGSDTLWTFTLEAKLNQPTDFFKEQLVPEYTPPQKKVIIEANGAKTELTGGFYTAWPQGKDGEEIILTGTQWGRTRMARWAIDIRGKRKPKLRLHIFGESSLDVGYGQNSGYNLWIEPNHLESDFKFFWSKLKSKKDKDWINIAKASLGYKLEPSDEARNVFELFHNGVTYTITIHD